MVITITKKVGLLFAALGTVGLTGCGIESDGADEYRQALPQRQTVEIAMPAGASTTQALMTGEGATSTYYKLTRTVSRDINGAVLAVLGLVRAVVRHPPTELSDNSAIWGPFAEALDPIAWKVTVTRVSPGNYSYKFEGQPKNNPTAAFETVLSGTHQPMMGSDGLPVESFGSGTFVLDFEARNRLPLPERDVGTASVTYARPAPGNPVAVTATFTQVRDDERPGRRVDVDYVYNLRPSGEGDLQFSFKPDPTAVREGPARVSVNSRWTAAGAGRSDVQAKGGTLPADPATANECWDTNFNSVYFLPSWAPAFGYGMEAACAYSTAVYSTLPL